MELGQLTFLSTSYITKSYPAVTFTALHQFLFANTIAAFDRYYMISRERLIWDLWLMSDVYRGKSGNADADSNINN